LECFHVLYDEIASNDIKSKNCKAKDALNGPSCGWKWAETHNLTTDTPKLLFRYDLRKMGYCFWDAARLDEYWDCSQSFEASLSKLQLAPRRMDDDGQGWKAQEPESGLHAMFQDVPIPKGALDHNNMRLFEDRLKEGRVFVFDNDEPPAFPAPFSEREAEMFGFEY
jgi:hypothetical protein